MAKSKYLDLTGLSKFKDKITSLLVSHTLDNNIHTSTEEKEKISTAYSHSTSVHAPTDATKVEKSSTNGNIKINGNETIVYDDSSLSSNVTQNTTELQDIRVKADGTSATSAGNAVREQVSELKSEIADKATLENGLIKFWKTSAEENETDVLLYSVDISSIGGTVGLDLENLTLSVSQIGNCQRLSMSDGTTTKTVDIPITAITDEQVSTAVNNYLEENPVQPVDTATVQEISEYLGIGAI